MPTGYTAALYDGEQTFEAFALDCARAFGALIDLRDSPKAPIPEEFTADTAHAEEQIALANGRLVEAQGWTVARAAEMARQAHVEDVARWEAAEAKRVEKLARYTAMLSRVRAWSPPTEDHVELREFMVQQLTSSIEHDCSTTPPPARATGADFRQSWIDSARRDLTYYRSQIDGATKRAADRTAWVRALRASLEGGRTDG